MKIEPVVYLSEESIRGALIEVENHPQTECMVQIPGRRKKEEIRFYFDMVADSGINAKYEYAMVEKDHEYTDHLCNRIIQLYDIPEDEITVTLLHLHQKGWNEFSTIDHISNMHLAQTYGGAVVGLMWVEPEFHIKFWYIDEEGNYYPAKTVLDDERVRKAMPKKNIYELKEQVERNTYPEQLPKRRGKRYIDLFRFFKKEKSAKDEKILEAFPELKAEFQEIGKNRKIHTTRRLDKTWLFSIEKNPEEQLYFTVGRDEEQMYVITEGKKVLYENDLIKRLLEMRDIEEILPIEELMQMNIVYKVFIPEEMKKSRYTGPLYGYYHHDTRIFNIVPEAFHEKNDDTKLIGYIKEKNEIGVYDIPEENFVCGVWMDELHIQIGTLENEVDVEYISFDGEAFSRNGTLAEANIMKDLEVNILGVGSVGSYIALECARLGIGRINLFDDDQMMYHNISRHQCGIRDVGKFKVHAIKERIMNINPYCEVNAFPETFQCVDPQELEKVIHENSIFICGTDNRHAAHICNHAADKFHIPMVAVGCGTRASTGEVFYYKPDSDMVTYAEAFGEDCGVDYSNQQFRRRFYATEAELEKWNFQPGLSLDITLTSIVALKLAVDLLMEEADGYEPKLLPYMKQGIMIVNHPTDEEKNPIMKIFKDKNGEVKPLQWKNVVGNTKG